MDQISSYHQGHTEAHTNVMEQLRKQLDKTLGNANSRLWHGAPVWFVEQNPVAGYSVNSRGVCLLFWNGRAFQDEQLHPVGKFFAAELRFQDTNELDLTKIRRLIRRSKVEIWDSVGHLKKARSARVK